MLALLREAFPTEMHLQDWRDGLTWAQSAFRKKEKEKQRGVGEENRIGWYTESDDEIFFKQKVRKILTWLKIKSRRGRMRKEDKRKDRIRKVWKQMANRREVTDMVGVSSGVRTSLVVVWSSMSYKKKRLEMTGNTICTIYQTKTGIVNGWSKALFIYSTCMQINVFQHLKAA